jgi:hypothetical protein
VGGDRRLDRHRGRLPAKPGDREGGPAQHHLPMPGNVFEANTVLPDPQQAGLRIVLHFPYSANVHCEIDVDDNVFTQLDQFVRPTPGNTDPNNGALQCGATPDRLGLPSG